MRAYERMDSFPSGDVVGWWVVTDGWLGQRGLGKLVGWVWVVSG